MKNDLSELRDQFGMTAEAMRAVIFSFLKAQNAGLMSYDTATSLESYLNLLETEVLQNRRKLKEYEEERSAATKRAERLKIKNGNYRLGMKQLQRAHVALLYRFQTLKNTVDCRYQEESQYIVPLQPREFSQADNGFEGGAFQGRQQVAGQVNTRL